MHAWLTRVRRLLLETELSSYRKRIARWPVYLTRLAWHIGRQWARDRCPARASALAFATALSLVPTLAVAFALLKATGSLEAQSALIDFVSNHLFPAHGERISASLIRFADNIHAGVLGATGSGITVLIAYLVFGELESSFNDIWRVTRRRSVLGKFVIFYTVITLVPFLVGLSLYHTAQYWRQSHGALGWMVPLLLVWGALMLANRLLPRAPVRWRSAAIGGLFSAVLFELAKRAFALYLSDLLFRQYTGVYGALALVPLLLVWIYYTWMVVLLGAEVAYAVQNLHSLEDLDRRSRPHAFADYVNGVVATRLLHAVARAFQEGRKAVGRIELAERFDLPVEIVVRLLDRLKAADLVVEVEGDVSGYMLARPPGDITVEAALASFRAVDVRVGEADTRRLNLLLRELEALRRGASERVTYADLLAPAASEGASTPDRPPG